MQLMSAHALLRRAEHEGSEPPLRERNLGTLENAPDCDGELPLATVAVVEAWAMGMLLAADQNDVLNRTTMRGTPDR